MPYWATIDEWHENNEKLTNYLLPSPHSQKTKSIVLPPLLLMMLGLRLLPMTSRTCSKSWIWSTINLMKLLFRISRLQYHPGRTDAKKIINGLGPEAAAFAIQIVVVNFVRNKRLSKMRSHMKQQVEASRKERRMAAKVKVDPPAAAK